MKFARLVLLALSLVFLGAALVLRATTMTKLTSPWMWPLFIAATALAVAAQRGVVLTGTPASPPSAPPSARRRVFGIALAVVGAVLWLAAAWGLTTSWTANFDRAWLAWLLGACALSVGLDLATAVWKRPEAARHLPLWWTASGIVAVALAFRFGTFVPFPAESHITQIEELQVGAMGSTYLDGGRERWEYLSHAWLGALGIGLGGPNLMAMRTPFTLVSALKVIPLFLWLRFAIGTPGAIVGSTLLAVSAWDSTLARVPTNQNTLFAALVFALLAGPAARGRPSAFVWLGFTSGYVLYEYVAYRVVAVYALLGGALVALQQRGAALLGRVGRPLVAVALFVVMGLTLLAYMQRTGTMYQYADGWGRARAQRAYYNQTDTWGEAVRKRVDRASRAVGLFYFVGDESPTRNPLAKPMTDPVTGALALLGVAYGLANPLRRLAGLAVFALFTTLAGTLVATGNFDPVRAGGAVPYFYGLVGYGAASVLEMLTVALGRAGRRLGIGLLVAAVLAAAVHNASFLWEFSTSPVIRQNQFRELAYISAWVGRNAGPDDWVVAIAPNNTVLFEINDAIWLRGRKSYGTTSWDVAGAFRKMAERNGPLTLLIYAGAGTHAARQYLERLLPEAKFEIEAGPRTPLDDIVHARIAGLPQDWEQRLAAAECHDAQAHFEVFTAAEAPEVMVDAHLPFVDPSAFPQQLQSAVYKAQSQLRRVEATISSTFTLSQAGQYTFDVETPSGSADGMLDGKKFSAGSRTTVELQPGVHHLEVKAHFRPGAFPSARLRWLAPGGKLEVMPFYSVGVCPPAEEGAS